MVQTYFAHYCHILILVQLHFRKQAHLRNVQMPNPTPAPSSCEGSCEFMSGRGSTCGRSAFCSSWWPDYDEVGGPMLALYLCAIQVMICGHFNLCCNGGDIIQKNNQTRRLKKKHAFRLLRGILYPYVALW